MNAPFAPDERQDRGNQLVVERPEHAGHFQSAIAVERLALESDGAAQAMKHQPDQAFVGIVEPFRIEQGRSLARVAIAGRVYVK